MSADLNNEYVYADLHVVNKRELLLLDIHFLQKSVLLQQSHTNAKKMAVEVRKKKPPFHGIARQHFVYIGHFRTIDFSQTFS